MSAVLHIPTPASAMAEFDSFRKGLPLTVAQARRGIGGYVMFDLGQEQGRDKITCEPQFDWHLWIYMCDWDLYKNENRILWRQESDNALAGAILGQLKGEILTLFEVDETDDCFVLHFTGGFRLHIDPGFHGYDAADDMFMLFRYGKNDCLSFSPKRRFYSAA